MISHIERPTGPEFSPDLRQGHLDAVSRDVMRRESARWTTVPLEQRDAFIDKTYGHGMLDRMRGFSEQAKPVVASARAALDGIVESVSPDATERLEQIYERLTADPPAYEDDPDEEHAYLRLKRAKPLHETEDSEDLLMYTIDNKTVLADITFLESLKQSLPAAAYPEQIAALSALIVQLNTYRFQDPKNAIRQQMDMPENAMDRGGKQLGRIALVGVLAAGTAVFGSIAAVNFVRKREVSVVPLLWGFGTWFLADKTLVEGFFDRDEPIKKDFDQIRQVTANADFLRLSKAHGIGGDAWARTVERLYDADKEELHLPPNATDADKQAMARRLAGGDARIEERLLAMMQHRSTGGSDFDALRASIAPATKDETREFVVTYVRNNVVREGLKLDPTAGRILKSSTR